MVMQEYPPYLVQAHRPGQFTTWFTDSRHESLPDALEAAKELHYAWNRKVRVIDQNERVHFRLPGRRA
jgi:hypothetical protein